jgi:hypothetical protein
MMAPTKALSVKIFTTKSSAKQNKGNFIMLTVNPIALTRRIEKVLSDKPLHSYLAVLENISPNDWSLKSVSAISTSSEWMSLCVASSNLFKFHNPSRALRNLTPEILINLFEGYLVFKAGRAIVLTEHAMLQVLYNAIVESTQPKSILSTNFAQLHRALCNYCDVVTLINGYGRFVDFMEVFTNPSTTDLVSRFPRIAALNPVDVRQGFEEGRKILIKEIPPLFAHEYRSDQPPFGSHNPSPPFDGRPHPGLSAGYLPSDPSSDANLQKGWQGVLNQGNPCWLGKANDAVVQELLELKQELRAVQQSVRYLGDTVKTLSNQVTGFAAVAPKTKPKKATMPASALNEKTEQRSPEPTTVKKRTFVKRPSKPTNE